MLTAKQRKQNVYIALSSFLLVSYIIAAIFALPLSASFSRDSQRPHKGSLGYEQIAQFAFQGVGAVLFGCLADVGGRKVSLRSALLMLQTSACLTIMFSGISLFYYNEIDTTSTKANNWLIGENAANEPRIDALGKHYTNYFKVQDEGCYFHVQNELLTFINSSVNEGTTSTNRNDFIHTSSSGRTQDLNDSQFIGYCKKKGNPYNSTDINGIHGLSATIDLSIPITALDVSWTTSLPCKPLFTSQASCKGTVDTNFEKAINLLECICDAVEPYIRADSAISKANEGVVACASIKTVSQKGKTSSSIEYIVMMEEGSVSSSNVCSWYNPQLPDEDPWGPTAIRGLAVAFSCIMALCCGGLYSITGSICKENAHEVLESSYVLSVMMCMQGVALFLSNSFILLLLYVDPNASVSFLSFALKLPVAVCGSLVTVLAFYLVEDVHAYSDSKEVAEPHEEQLIQVEGEENHTSRISEENCISLRSVWGHDPMETKKNEAAEFLPTNGPTAISTIISDAPVGSDTKFIKYKRDMKHAMRYHGRSILGICIPWATLNMMFYGYGIIHFSFLAPEIDSGVVTQPQALISTLVAAFSMSGYFFTIYLMQALHFKMLQFAGFIVIGFVYFGLFACLYGVKFTSGDDTVSSLLTSALYDLVFHYFFCIPNCTTFFTPLHTFPACIRATMHGVATLASRLGTIVGFLCSLYLLKQLSLPIVLLILCSVAMFSASATIAWTPHKPISRSDEVLS